MVSKLAENDAWHILKKYAAFILPKFKQKFPLPTAYTQLASKGIDVDIVAKLLLPSDAPRVKPLVTEANGNCLFNAVSMILFGNDNYHIEMRVRTVCELILNEDIYLNNKKLRQMSDESLKSCDILQYLISTCESYITSNGNVKEAYRAEVMQTIFEYRFCSMLHIYAITNMLNIMVHSVYPNITNVGVNRKIHHQIITPYNRGSVPKMPVYIMWSNKTELLVTKEWQPDHFVTLIPHQVNPEMYIVKETVRGLQDIKVTYEEDMKLTISLQNTHIFSCKSSDYISIS